MQQIENADIGTEICDNLPAELLEEKFNRMEFNQQHGINPSNPNGDHLWDEKGLIKFSQEFKRSKEYIDRSSEQNSEVSLMDIIHDEDGIQNKKNKDKNKKSEIKKKNEYEEMELGIRKIKKNTEDKDGRNQPNNKNMTLAEEAEIELARKLGRRKDQKQPT